MNIRSFFGAFAVIGLFNAVAGFFLAYSYQAGVFEGYNGEAGIDWDAFGGTFGGLGSFFVLVGGLLLMAVLGGIAAVLAHYRQRVLAFIFVILVGVIGILMGVFTNWPDIDWLGVWNLIWPFLVWVAVTAIETLSTLFVYERIRP